MTHRTKGERKMKKKLDTIESLSALTDMEYNGFPISKVAAKAKEHHIAITGVYRDELLGLVDIVYGQPDHFNELHLIVWDADMDKEVGYANSQFHYSKGRVEVSVMSALCSEKYTTVSTSALIDIRYFIEQKVQEGVLNAYFTK